MALAKYFQKDGDECLIHCDQVYIIEHHFANYLLINFHKATKLNSKNIKAFYRKAVIYYERDLFDNALEVK
jgi:hypothetical protein